MDTNGGSGELMRSEAGCTGKMRIKLRFLDMFDGGDIGIFAPVALA
jgi:hypothetical protein